MLGAVLIAAIAVGPGFPIMLGVLAPFLQTSLNLSIAQIGWLSSLVRSVGTMTALVAGFAADRYSLRPLFLAQLLLFTIALTIIAGSRNLLHLIVALSIAGMAVGIAHPATNRLIAQQLPRSRSGSPHWY